MKGLELAPVVLEGFSFKPALAGSTIAVDLSGTGDMHAMSPLGAALKQLHTEVARLGVQTVVVNISDLYFLNSSCLKQMVTWVKQVRESPAKRRYEIRFATNINLHWQRRTLDALMALGDGVVTLQTQSK
jgi:hypothetical protein